MKKAQSRRFLKFHLSTAVLMMFAAAIAMFLNCRGLQVLSDDLYGFPFAAVCVRYHDEPWEWDNCNLLLDAAFWLLLIAAIALASEFRVHHATAPNLRS